MTKVEWSLAGKRLTIFWEEPSTSTPWATIFGGEPDNMQVQRPINSRQESRNIGAAKILLINSPGRTDIVLDSGVPLESVDAAVEREFWGFITTYLPKENRRVARIALGAMAFSKANDRISGYQVLKGLLKNVAVEPEKTSDLTYSINWPTTSSTDSSIKVNRISKWAVIQTANFQFGPNMNILSSLPTMSAVQVEVDINTQVEPVGDAITGKLMLWVNELEQYLSSILAEGEPSC